MIHFIILGGAILATPLVFLFLFNGNNKNVIANAAASNEMIIHDGAVDIIIVGAGVAGSALAYALGKDGRRVLVIERDLAEPDRIFGELLQPGGYLKLMELDLQDCVDGIDSQKLVGCSVSSSDEGIDVKVAYPLEKFHPDVAGRAFLNGRFVQRLRDKASAISSNNEISKSCTYQSMVVDKREMNYNPHFLLLTLLVGLILLFDLGNSLELRMVYDNLGLHLCLGNSLELRRRISTGCVNLLLVKSKENRCQDIHLFHYHLQSKRNKFLQFFI
ncbi:hypothetical protein MKW98_031281 [Papaver atlanticum]|uniref:Squalene monooxygenase n=1 Tax=Papaver atlanticum TaxID=357466 RepID=A0AAD4S4Y5_9MAGN|nr:hypothetical protein MKW98_031281 [Papaver atlanticum]